MSQSPGAQFLVLSCAWNGAGGKFSPRSSPWAPPLFTLAPRGSSEGSESWTSPPSLHVWFTATMRTVGTSERSRVEPNPLTMRTCSDASDRGHVFSSQEKRIDKDHPLVSYVYTCA